MISPGLCAIICKVGSRYIKECLAVELAVVSGEARVGRVDAIVSLGPELGVQLLDPGGIS